ncbi:hypothetical protein [Fusibacter sp. 3D3]|nr:hypothetical protein [Fusibacter sp. 3D3]GAU77126.1 hypothetical protein F3D3_1725 [Fusibacter sp. 3D3]GAU79923.1 hypothetical protein F3D3_4588 [Fusibacter sp. 3D3]GAU80085.1 hypothetical protein F3D3_4751 [Fusibacter sp. 3D3]GAU80107.1 hypothetical protein F3D3_4773 [Fusibacter sp. 3D3]
MRQRLTRLFPKSPIVTIVAKGSNDRANSHCALVIILAKETYFF